MNLKQHAACTRSEVNIYQKYTIIDSDKLARPAMTVHTDYTNDGQIQKNKK